jgi:adenylate cyclase
MIQEGYKRKLTAILSADVEGYSRLMGEDEDATISTLTTYRELMTTLIKKHRGRVVDSPGDNLLAEFLSVVDAVRCAVEIQEELRIRNAELPENRRMQFRIGINLGDVVQEGERIYGDGINIAARVEGLAEGGGICISGTVYDSIKNKLSLSYESLGEHTVKNITEPVRVYRMRVGPEAVVQPKPKPWRKAALAALVVLIVAAGAFTIWQFYFRPPPLEPASVEKMVFPLPDKPSIAVLPFINMSEDPKQEYFSDGLTEEIITALSKLPKLFVIARNSTFTYKGKAVKVNQVAEELGVQYVLEGSVRKAEDKLRITAQLIDALTGHHLWAERYDRDLKDIFVLQDEITKKIITALQVELTEGEMARLSAKGTGNLQAYLKLLQGREPFYTLTKEGNVQARSLFEEAVALDPEYAAAYLYVGVTHWMDFMLRSSKSPKESLKQAFKFIKKAKALDDSHPWAHTQLGWLYVMTKQYDKGMAECERAITLAPNSANAHIWMSLVLSVVGRHEESVQYAEQALRLDPLPVHWYFRQMGTAYSFVGRYEEAIAFQKKALQRAPNDILTHVHLTRTYSWAGRLDEARAQADQVLRINPEYSLELAAKTSFYKKQTDRERHLDGLRKAGIPETPPLPLPDKSSIAVLPFTNMSDDPKQEYFSDGITEEIITALSKTPKLFVIARNSSFTYKGKAVKVQQVGRELGVKYVLEGSVRKAGDKARITAQLVDAQTGNHLWAERYDRDLKDIFTIQDDITKNIIAALQVKLTEGEQVRAAAKGTNNLEAYLKYLQAIDKISQFNRESNALGKQLAQEAIALDPEYAMAYGALHRTYLVDVWLGTSKSPKQSIAKAMELIQKAIELDATYAEAHGHLGFLFSMIGEHDKAVAKGEQAVALNPNSAYAHMILGHTLRFAGRSEEAIPEYKKAIRLNPIPPTNYLFGLGLAYCWTDQYEEAIKWCEKAVRKDPDSFMAHLMMTVVYSLSGREEEARAEADEALRINPKFSVEKFEKAAKLKKETEKKRFIGALRDAGLK